MIKKILKRGMAVTLAMSLVTGLAPAGIGPVRNVKKAKATVLSFQTGDGTASPPSFNSANFPTFDQNTGETEYYFGKYGNAFYGVGTNGTDSKGNTCGFTDETTWELVDTDSKMNGTSLSSQWGSSGSSSSGQKILDYTNGLTDTYFSAADQKVMKSQSVVIDTYKHASNYEGLGIGSVSNAKLWPLSAKQMMQSDVTPNDNIRSQVNNLEKRLCSNSSEYVWTRSFGGSNYYYYAWLLCSNNLDGNSITNSRSVAPAFALDLTQVVKTKSYGSGYKFLINVSTEKSNFTVSSIAGKNLSSVYNGKTYEFNYSGASTSTLNSGTNYISAIIYDSNGKIVYYEELDTVNSETGTARITIPTLTVGQNYTLALFEEEKCIGGKTDYASEPVYASFTAKAKMNLSYDVLTNGGTSTAPSSITEIDSGTVYGNASGVFNQTALKEGWEFVGWNTDKDAHEGLTTLTMDSDKTLYAIFKKDLTITFKDVGN